MYNVNFQIAPHKITNSNESLLDDPKPVAFLHRMKKTYPDFATLYQSLARAKISAILDVMEKLKDEC